MENSRLPIEVCERVIDECSNFYWEDRSETLRACALTCSQWLPRSRYNLYHELRLEDSEAAGLIVDTITARPELAEHVRVIHISLGDDYVPLTQVLSLPLLKKCQRLEINIDWDNFPPRYVQNCLVPLLTNFGSVVELNYTVRSAASAIEFFHIIWAMPQLLSCQLDVGGEPMLTAVSLANLEQTALKIKPRLHLTTLMFGIGCSNLAHIQGYPPQGAFGSLVNLTKFDFRFTIAAPVSDSFLQFLGEMVSLEELTITVWFKDDSRPGGADLLAQMLRYTQSSHLKKCDIDFWVGSWHYGCKRGDLLEIISGEAMQWWLQHLPSIPEFIIRVEDNDAAFNKDWWTTEITKNLPALKDTLTVHVDSHVWNKHLWIKESESAEDNGYEEQVSTIKAFQ